MLNQETPLKILDNISLSDWNAGVFVYTNATSNIKIIYAMSDDLALND